MVTALISIVIPTYQRAHLIGETLDSILAQTHQNWECIIVDDGSTDHTEAVLKPYLEDVRFVYQKRPVDSPKGANACRNVGLKMATGQYVVFFDSDDLMTPHHLEVKLITLLSRDYDFVVAKTEYFNASPDVHPMNYRQIEHLPITADHFITKKINWTTLDLLIKSNLAKSIQFTEKNQSAEEYNYFCKLVLTTKNAQFVNQVLSLRRYHEQSFQYGQDVSMHQRYVNYFYYYWDTYQELYQHPFISLESRQYLMNNAMTLLFKIDWPVDKTQFVRAVFREKGLLGLFSIIKHILKKRPNDIG